MNTSMILSVVFVAGVCAIIGTEAYCPTQTLCKNDDTPCPEGQFTTTSYTKTVNGELCPSGCTHCLPNGKYCPDMTCPSLFDAPEGCQTTDVLYVKIDNDKECVACDVHIC
ncbi:hypothetical protein ACF0H5_017458 [Mactra antiquata]